MFAYPFLFANSLVGTWLKHDLDLYSIWCGSGMMSTVPSRLVAIRRISSTFQLVPTPRGEGFFTSSEGALLRSDNIVSSNAQAEGRDFTGLGITPSALESIVPSYLWRFRKTGQFKVRGA